MQITGSNKAALSRLRAWRVAAAALAWGVAATTTPAWAQVQGVTDNEIVIGVVQDLSGPVASAGVPTRDGMLLAVDEINDKGGIHGRKLRLVVEDAAFDPKKGVLATQKLLTQDKVFAMVSTLGSAIVQATMPMVLERNVPMLFPQTATEISYLPHHALKFGMMITAVQQMQAEIRYAHDKLGKRRFALLYQDDETGQSFLRAAETQLKLHGLALLQRASFKRGDTNFASQVALLKAANPDLLVLGTNPRETAAAAVETRAQSWTIEMISPTATPAVVSLGGAAVEGLYGTGQLLGAAQAMTPALKAVTDRFSARFGRPIADATSTGYGYSAVMLFAEGARHAGRDLTPQSLGKGMELVRNFQTPFAMVPVSYDATNHGPPGDVIILLVKGGKWVPVGGPVLN